MPKKVLVSATLDALTLKLARLALVAPDELYAVDTLVDAALKHHRAAGGSN